MLRVENRRFGLELRWKNRVRRYFIRIVQFSKKDSQNPYAFGCFDRFDENQEITHFGGFSAKSSDFPAKKCLSGSGVLTEMTKLPQPPSLEGGLGQ